MPHVPKARILFLFLFIFAFLFANHTTLANDGQVSRFVDRSWGKPQNIIVTPKNTV